MSNQQQLKLSIQSLVEEIDDDSVLQAYYEILQSLIKLTPKQQNDQELEKNILEASKRVKSGKFIKHNDLKKESENW